MLVIIIGNSAGWDNALLAPIFFAVWFFKFIVEANNGFRIRNIFIVFLSLQYLLGPYLSYMYDNESIYSMVIPSQEYFSFAFTGVLLIGIGLFYNSIKSDEDDILKNVKINFIKFDSALFEKLFFISIFFHFFPFKSNTSFDFVIYFIISLKYVYVCYIILSGKKINYLLLAIPVTLLVLQSLNRGMFHDLLTWMIFWGISLAIKLKPSFIQKIIAIGVFVFLVVIIQLAKQNFRSASSVITKENSSFKVFRKTAESEIEEASKFSLIQNIVRINQGWITARTMNNIPKRVDYANFDLINKYFEAAFMPRILAPDKIRAGDRELLNKYSGIIISFGTSMGIGIVGDAWASFGYFGGLVMLFCFGLLLNYSLKYFQYLIKYYPLVYFLLPIIYIYPIRPDCETQTSMGHLVKTTFLVSFIVFYFMKRVKSKSNKLIINAS
ncbi:MAG: hypothetical protein KGZ59_11090 [Chitinophagaceae bacterium]|nr:hypothetical protein [Chitinophagaceae bacterium]